MVYLPTCIIKINEMKVNIPYMDPLGTTTLYPPRQCHHPVRSPGFPNAASPVRTVAGSFLAGG